MININILFPSEKRRIKEEVSKEIQSKYNQDVKRFKFQYVGDEKVCLYVFLEDGTPLYITAEINRIVDSMTIEDDMSL